MEAIPEVELRLGEWLKAHEGLASSEVNLQDGHHLMAMLKVITLSGTLVPSFGLDLLLRFLHIKCGFVHFSIITSYK